jgi:imidazolonepropionase
MRKSDNRSETPIDSLWVNVHLATMMEHAPYGAIEDGALAVSKGRIVWTGKKGAVPREIELGAEVTHDGHGAWVTPGLVDCHTHLVYAGNRAPEFEMRLQGATYEEIALHGGGIRSTVSATRAAGDEGLFRQSAARLEAMLAEGVTAVEIKSGYGLDLLTELKMLRVARRLGESYPVTVFPTFLGAHALPPEFDGKGNEYIDFICTEVLPKVAGEGLATAVDVFCDRIGFNPDQTEQVFRAAKGLGLRLKVHAEQLSDQGGAELAARYGALSADHLERLSEAGVKALAKSGTVAVLLPGAFYFMRERQTPPVASLREHGVPMAVSTDSNPGTSPTTSLLLMLNMACTLFRLTPEEALAGATINAAKALGLEERIGTLTAGKDADFVVWDISSPGELSYGFGFNPCLEVIRHGKIVRQNKRPA